MTPLFHASQIVRLKRTGSLWTVCDRSWQPFTASEPATYINPVTGALGYVVSLNAQPDLLHIYPASALEEVQP